MLIDGNPLDRPAAPLNDLLRPGLDAGPDEVATTSAERALSWRELDEESSALAGGYLELGLEAGDRLASLMPNRIDLVVHYLACFKAGLVAVPLNYRYTHREIDHALEVSGAGALLAHVERAEDVAASRLAGEAALGTIAYGAAELPDADLAAWGRSFEALLESEPLPVAEEVDPSLPAAIFFTSGSTGPASLHSPSNRPNAPPAQRGLNLQQ